MDEPPNCDVCLTSLEVAGTIAHPYPASWHRAIIARVAHEVPGLSITYG